MELAYDDASPPLDFGAAAVLPEAGDNCAIARAPLAAGTRVRLPSGATVRLAHAILEGHRFAVEPVAAGEHLRSWSLTFGIALVDIVPGQYVANERVLLALRARGLSGLPEAPAFRDIIVPHVIDEAAFKPAEQVPLVAEAERRTWLGVPRAPGRGTGTRNYVILIGATSLGAGYVRALEARVQELGLAAGLGPGLDGVVAVAHTEGGGARAGPRPHNFELLCRTLTAFMVHPNVAAALVVDYGSPDEALWCDDLQAWAAAHPAEAPLGLVPHKFLRLSGDLEADLAAGAAVVESWLPAAAACARVPSSLEALSIAQQCGGSDAFSGVSGNPCAGEACMLLIRQGGQAVLAETDELMGAESYILKHVKDLPTAKKFVGIVEAFKERLAWHGQSAESNPSGGNNFRGLYNIGLKSLGAAKKKHADVRLDGVLDYAERSAAQGRGYFMMDSPGNDLESIAGQVATGCNLIYFITGNGSITNFPFVPTIKIVTTTARFELLRKDMDFNAGRYQEGTPMAELGRELFELTLGVCNGARSVGEKAGHAQVSLWRNWMQSGPTDVARFSYTNKAGSAVRVRAEEAASAGAGAVAGGAVAASEATVFGGSRVAAPGAPAGAPRPYVATERIGLILPTSLCSGEVARQITARLNALVREGAPGAGAALARRVSRFECLPHTEGCGTAYAEGGMQLYERVMLGHLTHPSVGMALCLEHGCEKTHNDFFHNAMAAAGVSASAFGYASIQLDGGIEAVTERVLSFFAGRAAAPPAEDAEAEALGAAPSLAAARVPLPLLGLDLALLVTDPAAATSPELGLMAAALARALAAGGGALVVPSTSPLLRSRVFAEALGVAADADSEEPLEPTLAFGQRVRPLVGPGASAEAVAAVRGAGGLHVMDMLSRSVRDWSDTVTGLAATGAHAILALSLGGGGAGAGAGTGRAGGPGGPGHPMVPLLHLVLSAPGAAPPAPGSAALAADAMLSGGAAGASSAAVAAAWAHQALAVVGELAAGTRVAKGSRNTFFSIARGPTGVST